MIQQPFNLHCAFNGLSFGNVSISLTREMLKRGLTPAIFPMGGQVDLGTQKPDNDFNTKLGHLINSAQQKASRKHPTIKLWHIQDSIASYSERGNDLLTFFELDALTPSEVHILKQQHKVYVTSHYTQTVFSQFGITSTYLPLGFDSHNFFQLPVRPRAVDARTDRVISFLLAGKLEKRKGHFQVLNLWAKKYGNKPEYKLNCAVHNPFMKPEDMNALISQALEGKQYWNIQFLPWHPTNAEYNVTLQSSDIILSCSGGEGRDLPCYHATAMGAHPVALRAHAYLDYLNDGNAVLISPNGKQPATDGLFFAPNSPFNSGNIFTFGDDDFYAACEEAEKRARVGINFRGMELQKQSYSEAVDILLAGL